MYLSVSAIEKITCAKTLIIEGVGGAKPKGMVRYTFSGEGQGHTLVPFTIPVYEIK